MQSNNRIPGIAGDISIESVRQWFRDMNEAGLMFHPEEDPADIFWVNNDMTVFSVDEVNYLRELIDKMDAAIGHDQVIAAAYPVFMKACGNDLEQEFETPKPTKLALSIV